jgi:hypothetical protein
MNLRGRVERLERELPARPLDEAAACEVCGRMAGFGAAIVVAIDEMDEWLALRSCPRCDGGLIVLPDNGY